MMQGKENIESEIKIIAQPLDSALDLDPIMEAAADRRVVLIGEASHGTADYYRWRNALTTRLIAEQDYNFVAVNAEKYYRTMLKGGANSWNLRDTHMMETLERLLDFHGKDARGIVWAHNTHIGDAAATDMANEGMINIGQLARERLGEENVFLVGFSGYQGTVVASGEWEGQVEVMDVPRAALGSWEEILHQAIGDDLLMVFKPLLEGEQMFLPRGQRAIGVVYNPEFEGGNYVPTILPLRYDALIHLENTTALTPLKLEGGEDKEAPQTFPSGV